MCFPRMVVEAIVSDASPNKDCEMYLDADHNLENDVCWTILLLPFGQDFIGT